MGLGQAPLFSPKWLHFIALSVGVFCYKLIFAWRGQVYSGWQDEILWNEQAIQLQFLPNLTQLDSGYPTPILRLMTFVCAHVAPQNFVALHLLTLIIIGISVGSIYLLDGLSTFNRLSLAVLVASYPSFDLLLLHNVSYWTFLPLLVLIVNSSNEDSTTLDVRKRFLLISLLVTTTKPQLLLCILPLLIHKLIQIKAHRRFHVTLICISILLLILGRNSNKTLGLEIDLYSLSAFFLTLPSHFMNSFFPVFTLTLFSVAHFTNLTFFILASWISQMAVAIFLLAKFRSKIMSERTNLLPILCAFSLYTYSLYIFPNSGWSGNDLLFSTSYTPLFVRHYLPVIFLCVFGTMKLMPRNKFNYFLVPLAAFQFFLMQLLLFDTLYRPV